jgi:molybdopterin-guanine dinucleotide biosynthesis protein A
VPHDHGVAAIVLAGGKSARLGRDKASEPLLGRPMLQHVVDRVSQVADEIVVVSAPGQRTPDVTSSKSLRVIADAYPDTGPLGGICTGLEATEAPRALAVACDMPLLSLPLLAELVRRGESCDAVMPVLEFPEPLHAVYSQACVEPMRARLAAGQYKITGFLGAVRVCYVHADECRRWDPEGQSFLNTNTEEDLARVKEILRGT